MSFQFPVTFEKDVLVQYREELQWAMQELEMLAITLERNPDDMGSVLLVRNLFQELSLSSTKLDLIPISESLDDTLKGLDLLLDWQYYPVSMTEFVLLLIDKIMVIALEVEEERFIDMRKTQQILVALQSIILAKNVEQVKEGIDTAVAILNEAIPEQEAVNNDSGAIDLFGDDVDLFDDGVDLFDDGGVDLFDDQPSAETVAMPEVFIPNASLNPLNQAREYLQGHSDENCLHLFGQIAEQAAANYDSHTHFLLELSLAVNFMAGTPIPLESLHKGICLHDIALTQVPDLLTGERKLTPDEINELKQHPVKGVAMAESIKANDEACLLVLHHHERLDGSGYPYGLKGDNISEQGKLAAIVDSFHNTMERFEQLSARDQIFRAVAEINYHPGVKFDASWLEIFNRCIRDYWLTEWRKQQGVSLQEAS